MEQYCNQLSNALSAANTGNFFRALNIFEKIYHNRDIDGNLIFNIEYHSFLESLYENSLPGILKGFIRSRKEELQNKLPFTMGWN